MVGGSLLSDVEVAKIDTLRASLNYRKDDHKERADKSLPFQEEVSYTGSVGVENQFDPFKQLSMVGGLSYDWWDVTQADINTVTGNRFRGQVPWTTPDSDQLSPMAAVTYAFDDGTKLYGSWARKIRFPTLTNLYGSNGGNPDLKPEKSQNYILGASRPITRYARGELNLFTYDINDFITKDSTDRTAPYRNAQSVLIYGFEAIAEVFPMKDLSFRLGYTYNNSTDRSPGAPTERVTFVPTHKVDLSGRYLIPRIDVQTDLTALYVGRIWGQLPSLSSPSTAALRTGDYFVVDARISKVLANHVELYFVAHNIFDKNYEEEIGFPAPGRNLFVGVKYSY
jgi:outer membrane receptor protein involved in Fe transport